MARAKKVNVVKFGGSSIKNLNCSGVIDQITEDFPNSKIVCVLSASYGVTSELIKDFEFKIDSSIQINQNPDIDREVLKNSCLAEYDLLVSRGEISSIIDASISAKSRGIKCIALTGQQAGIRSNDNHGSAIIEDINSDRISSLLDIYDVIFVAGFQGACNRGFTTTLGRGASDLTAIGLANALSLSEVYIYTDVPAIYSSDPRKIDPEKLKEIRRINFEEALEIASFGGKVIHDRSVSLAQKYGTKIQIREATGCKSKVGTVICSKYETTSASSSKKLKAFASRENLTSFYINLQNKPGITEEVIQALSSKEVNLGNLIQSYSNNQSWIHFSTTEEDNSRCHAVLTKLKEKDDIFKFESDSNLCEVSVIGEQLIEENGFLNIFEKIFRENKIEPLSIFTNGIRITALVTKIDYDEFLTKLYEDFSKYI